MIYLAIALIVVSYLAYLAHADRLKFQRDLQLAKTEVQQIPESAVEDLRADVNRIKLMLNIRTFKAEGEKK